MAGRPHLPPLVFEPLQPETHTHTLIILHGRGSNALRFGPTLLDTTNLRNQLPSVRFVFPTAISRRAVAMRRVRIHQWFDIFSLEDPNERVELQLEGLQETGRYLRELAREEARSLGGRMDRVVLGGLSQGCAAALVAVLGGWFVGARGEDDGDRREDGEKLGGFFGMSGWLPLQRLLDEMLEVNGDAKGADEHYQQVPSSDREDPMDSDSSLQSDSHDGASDEDKNSFFEDEDKELSEDIGLFLPPSDIHPSSNNTDLDDPFSRSPRSSETSSDDPFSTVTESTPPQPPLYEAINYIRDVLDLPSLPPQPQPSPIPSPISTSSQPQPEPNLPSHLRLPIFLGHGTADPRVPISHCRSAATTLQRGLHMDVTVRTYKDFGHWYKVPDEIDDLVAWLRDVVGVPVVRA